MKSRKQPGKKTNGPLLIISDHGMKLLGSSYGTIPSTGSGVLTKKKGLESQRHGFLQIVTEKLVGKA